MLDFVSPWSALSSGGQQIGTVDGLELAIQTRTWPSANAAITYPFRLSRDKLLSALYYFMGGSQSGNIDLGIYTADGVRLISTGSVAAGTVNILHVLDVTDLVLPAGDYLAAMAASSATLQIMGQTLAGFTSGAFMLARGAGSILQHSTAMPLPAAFSETGVGADRVLAFGPIFHPSTTI